MVSYQNNLEIGPTPLDANTKLWRAVLNQALQDAFGYSAIPMNREEKKEAIDWIHTYDDNFITVCENAGFDPKSSFNLIQRYYKIKKEAFLKQAPCGGELKVGYYER